MNKLGVTIVAALSAFSIVATPPPPDHKKPDKTPRKPVISLSVGTAHNEIKTSTSGRRRNSANRSGTSRKTVKTVYSYEGRLYCKPPEGETATVTLEAFFVERADSDKGLLADKILAQKTIGTYSFTNGIRHTQNFSFSSPEIKTTRSTTRRRRWGNMNSKSRRSGTEYRGCFVRALCNGEVVAVKAVPGVFGWEKAGKMPVPSLKNANRL